MSTRVLFLFPEAWLGSTWGVNQMVIRHAGANGIEPVVLLDTLTQGETSFGDTQVSVHRMPLTGKGLLRSMPAIRRLVDQERIDVVHVNDSSPSLIAAVAVRAATRTPYLVHYHGIPSLMHGNRRRLQLAVSRLAAANVAVSRYVHDELIRHVGIRPSSLTWVLNGVDVERFSPKVDGTWMRSELGFGPDAISVIEPARFWQLKGQQVLVRAVAIARKQDPRIEAALIGWNDPNYDGPYASYREECEALAAKLGVADSVRFFTARAEAPEIVAAADIICLPSNDDPCSLVLLEALSSGRAFVGARSGGQPEVITNGENGLLVPPRSPEMLARALLKLASDPALRASLGNAGRQHAVKQLSEERVATRFAAIYRAITDHTALPNPTSSEEER